MTPPPTAGSPPKNISRQSSAASSSDESHGGAAPTCNFDRVSTLKKHKQTNVSRQSEHHELSPLHQYLHHALNRRQTKTRDFGQWLFGVPHSQAFNLRQLRIVNTTDHKFQDIIKNLMGVREQNAGDVNDVITMLRDTRVTWSYFDIIESDTTNRAARFVLCTWSIFGQMIATSMAMIAFISIWYTALICAFHSVLAADEIFYPGGTAYQTIAGVDIAADVLYCLGTLSHLRTTFIDPRIFVETCNPEKILRCTLRSPVFWADLLSCVPGVLLRRFPALSVNIQLLKGIRLRCLLSWIFDWNKTSLLVMRPYWQQVLRLVFFMFLLGHLVGCFWHSISSADLHPLLDASAGGARWALPQNADRPLLLYYAYFCKTGLYLALGIIVQGYSVTENALIVVLAPLGAVANALILSSIIVLVSRSTALETRSLERMEHLKQAISTQGLPASIQLRILAYHTQQRVQRSRVHTRSIFRGLSMQLHFELNLVLYFNLIIGADIFKKSHPRVLRHLVLVFEDKLYLPGDYVCRYADEGSEMYFVFKGLLSVISEHFVELSQMGKGRHFGEIALLTGQRRTAYVRANLFCMLASLSKKNFDSIMHEFPQQLELIMEQMSAKRRHWMQKLVSGKKSANGLHSGFEDGPSGGEGELTGATSRVSRLRASLKNPEGRASRRQSEVMDEAAHSSRTPSPPRDDMFPVSNSDGTNDSSAETPRRDSTIIGRLGGSVLGAKVEESSDSDEEDAKQDTDGHAGGDEEEDEHETDSSSNSSDQDPSELIDVISKRCSMALDTHNQFCTQLLKIAHQQHNNSKLATELNQTFERYMVEHASQERTVMLECICSDVDNMCRGIKESSLAMDVQVETGPSKMFSQAIARGVGESPVYGSLSDYFNSESGTGSAMTSNFHNPAHDDADRTVL